MQPGNYMIPADVQAHMRTLVQSLEQKLTRPRFPLSVKEKHWLATIVEKIEVLAEFPFSRGNQLVLTTPDFSFGYVRMGVDYFIDRREFTAPPVVAAAEYVRAWLDGLGHEYPRRRDNDSGH